MTPNPVETGRPRPPIACLVGHDVAARAEVREALDELGVGRRSYESGADLLADDWPGHLCLIVQSQLPDMTATELLAALRRAGRRLPAIVLASDTDIEAAVDAMRAGALDVVERPRTRRALLRHLGRLLGELEGHPPTAGGH